MIIKVNTGMITKLEFTLDSGNTGTLQIGSNTVANGVIEVSGSELTIVNSGKQCRINSITISYTE
jgi:uncharacterized protein with beta-barrel porin domain